MFVSEVKKSKQTKNKKQKKQVEVKRDEHSRIQEPPLASRGNMQHSFILKTVWNLYWS